jgi:hypothetical protein
MSGRADRKSDLRRRAGKKNRASSPVTAWCPLIRLDRVATTRETQAAILSLLTG